MEPNLLRLQYLIKESLGRLSLAEVRQLKKALPLSCVLTLPATGSGNQLFFRDQ